MIYYLSHDLPLPLWFNLMTDDDFMALALIQAKCAWDVGEVPVGAILVKEGVVIARARSADTHRSTLV